MNFRTALSFDDLNRSRTPSVSEEEHEDGDGGEELQGPSSLPPAAEGGMKSISSLPPTLNAPAPPTVAAITTAGAAPEAPEGATKAAAGKSEGECDAEVTDKAISPRT